MYLKSLELQGFKSFPDKIKLGFDKGLTAVVGPNGSGKSNIGDSIRWVLGEQSTKTLRGNKMEDVIFSGTVARKPVGFASVTLTLDNADRVLNCDDDEVSITRKLYRSGDSEYKINGKNVRLKDINELFMDTGLGRDGYSIIGQGRIAEIVSAKSNERRDIFEEAAGISKFRYKKIEAERKLSAAEDNLVRLNDIVSELENRVGPLKSQAEKAEKFVVLAGQRKTLEISVWVNKLSELKEKLSELENSLLLNKTEYENIQNDIDREEEKIQDGYKKIQESSVAIEELRDKILKTEQSASQYKSDIAVYENDISHSEESLKSIAAQQEKLQSSGEKAQQEIDEKLSQVENIKAECQRLEKEFSEIKAGFEKAQQEAAELSKNSDNAGTELNNLYIKLSECRSEISNSEMSAQDTESQLSELEKQRVQLKELSEQYAKEKDEIADGLKGFEEKSVEFSNMLSGVSKLLADKQNKLSVNKKEYEEIQYEIRGKEQRKKLLSDLENNMEGFARSVKEIVRASKSGRIGGIRGTVAQLINVKQEYAVAVETALGGAMQNVVVEDDTAAKRCIRLLKEQKSGRATFLPMTSVRGNVLNEPRLSGENGFVAMASELIDFDSQYQGIVNSLLGRTAVAEDIDCAAFIAKKFGYKFKIVTLDGQVVNAGGSFTGGSAAHSAGVFSRKNELEAIDNDIAVLQTRLSEASEKMRKIEEENRKLERKAQEINEDIAELNEDKIKFSAELSRIEALEKQSALQSQDFENRYNQLVEKRKNSAESAKTAQAEFEKTRVLIREAEQALAKEQGRREEIRKQREELSSKMSDMKIRITELTKDGEAAQREADTLKSGMTDSAMAVEALRSEEKIHLQIIEDKKKAIEKRKQDVDNVKHIVEKCNEDIKRYQDIHKQQEMHVNNLRSSIKEFTEAKEKYSGEIFRIEERKVSAQNNFDSIVSQLYEVYEMTRSEAEAVAEPVEDRVEATRQLNEVKAKIRSLGHVNVGAIEEYKEVSERYKFLSEQLDDVTNSKRELEKLIEDLTQDMCRIFSESFVIINENFQKIFTELFGGGKAELILNDPENVLESGIEIRVAPPGKVIKNLISLSGGEQSFVAICIYFAILKLRPAPFCILDEIDAALDEVNVKKYAQYLKNFTDTTQFVLVTHRRSAMEEANVLYGVTMQEDGISKLLKMEQTDIDSQAADTKDKEE